MHVIDGDKLRRARKRARFTQIDLARLCGVTQQYISALETGTDSDCSEQVAERVCRYIDVELEDYFQRREVTRTPAVTTRSRDDRSAKRKVPA